MDRSAHAGTPGDRLAARRVERGKVEAGDQVRAHELAAGVDPGRVLGEGEDVVARVRVPRSDRARRRRQVERSEAAAGLPVDHGEAPADDDLEVVVPQEEGFDRPVHRRHPPVDRSRHVVHASDVGAWLSAHGREVAGDVELDSRVGDVTHGAVRVRVPWLGRARREREVGRVVPRQAADLRKVSADHKTRHEALTEHEVVDDLQAVDLADAVRVPGRRGVRGLRNGRDAETKAAAGRGEVATHVDVVSALLERAHRCVGSRDPCRRLAVRIDLAQVRAGESPELREFAADVHRAAGAEEERVDRSVRAGIPRRDVASGIHVGQVRPRLAVHVSEQAAQVDAPGTVRNDRVHRAEDARTIGGHCACCGIERRMGSRGGSDRGKVATDIDRVLVADHGIHRSVGNPQVGFDDLRRGRRD